MERELQRLLDREQISDLIYAYCTHLDLNEPERVAALFTEDCVTDYGAALGGPTHGRDRLERGVARAMAGFEATSHHVSNIRLEFESDDSARSVTVLYAWHQLPGDQPHQHLYGQYHDRFVRTPDGWRIAERRMLITGHRNMPLDWTPIGRRPVEPRS